MTASGLLAVGDSHLEALKFAAGLGLLNAAAVDFCIVPGATAVGLRNPNSNTQALSLFREFVALKARSSHVLVHLGEVDCGYLFWWRQQKYGEPVEKQMRESLSAYRGFMEELRAAGFRQLCIAGASLPTIRNGTDYGAVANMRSEVTADLGERTALTLRYNAELAAMAADMAIFYFDITEGVLNRAEGVVAAHFRNPNPLNHHLDQEKVAGMWALACNNFLTGAGGAA